MQRTVPLVSAFWAATGGGRRVVVPKIDDTGTMQSASGSRGAKGEAWKSCEAPQNYGFTSVCFDADKPGQDGVMYGPEAVMQFMGGNNSQAMATSMDDRRHRLKGLKQGDSAQFRGKDDRQQFHMAGDGNYCSCRSDRVQRWALVPPPQQQQQQTPGVGDTGDTGSAGGQGGGQNKPKGQESALDDNKKASVFWQQDKDAIHTAHGGGHHLVKDKQAIQYVSSADNSHKVDDSHIHMNYGANSYWCDPGGVYASMPPIIQPDGDGGTSSAAVAFMSMPGAPAGPPAPLD